MNNVLQMNSLRDSHRDPARAQVACSQCSLGELCLPKNLDKDDKIRFEQIVHRSRPIHAGEHIFRAGDEFRTVATVRTGCFKSYAIDQDGQEQVLGFHLPGEIIGLDAIHSGRHIANVVALDTSAICSLTFHSVSSMARSMPELQHELFRMMSQRISELETIAGDLSADERIALFLLSLSVASRAAAIPTRNSSWPCRGATSPATCAWPPRRSAACWPASSSADWWKWTVNRSSSVTATNSGTSPARPCTRLT